MPIQYTDTKHMQKKTTLPRPLTEDTHTNTESFKIFYAYFYSAISAISGNNNEHNKYMWKTFFGKMLLLDHLHQTAEDLGE